ncbi:MAG: hypothetical protein D6722_09080 [Bacteroidetes bacterium]|nr:MAG: hypothetical protein D6722_09080 [Bacteroidota bacterium]
MMLFASLYHLLLQAQPGVLLRSDKVFAVLAVLLVIFGGIVFFLIQSGRKAQALESRIDELTGSDNATS